MDVSTSAPVGGQGKRTSNKSWVKRVLHVQSQRNPEELDAVRSRIEHARQMEVSARKCKALKGNAIRSRALAAEGLKQMAESNAPEDYAAAQERWRCAQQVSRARQETKCKKLGRSYRKATKRRARSRSSSESPAESRRSMSSALHSRFAPPARQNTSNGDANASCGSRASSPASVLRAASDSEEEAMEQAVCLVGATDASVMKSAAADGLALMVRAPPRAESASRGSSIASDSDVEVDASVRDASLPPRSIANEAAPHAAPKAAPKAKALSRSRVRASSESSESLDELSAESEQEEEEGDADEEIEEEEAEADEEIESSANSSESEVDMPSDTRQASQLQPGSIRGSKPTGEASVMAALLTQLRHEPKDEEECAAKFSLYEGYASEVENMRNTLLTFHAESCPTFPPAVATDMDRQIKAVDSEDAMRIPDRSREWFVYHMMRQAERNNLKMAGILEVFDKKLKFLAENDQAECPVCLESFGSGEHAPETLGCCHKVCKECWHQWSKVVRGRAFCPLCRNEEFLGAVAARASRPGPVEGDSASSIASSSEDETF